MEIDTDRVEQSLLEYLIDVAPFPALIISIAALCIGLYNLSAQLRACISASWFSTASGGTRILKITNTGPGTATIAKVELFDAEQNEAIPMSYATDRIIFPFELGGGGSFELQLNKKQMHPTNIRVDWKDGFFQSHSKRIPVFSEFK